MFQFNKNLLNLTPLDYIPRSYNINNYSYVDEPRPNLLFKNLILPVTIGQKYCKPTTSFKINNKLNANANSNANTNANDNSNANANANSNTNSKVWCPVNLSIVNNETLILQKEIDIWKPLEKDLYKELKLNSIAWSDKSTNKIGYPLAYWHNI
jgi:hypothetical protein